MAITPAYVHDCVLAINLLAVTGLTLFLEKLGSDTRRADFPLVVTHVTRNDIILGFLAHAQMLKKDGHSFGGALVRERVPKLYALSALAGTAKQPFCLIV